MVLTEATRPLAISLFLLGAPCSADLCRGKGPRVERVRMLAQAHQVQSEIVLSKAISPLLVRGGDQGPQLLCGEGDPSRSV